MSDSKIVEPFLAGADLSAAQYCIVQQEADGDVVLADDATTATGDKIVGVIDETGGAESGKAVSVVTSGPAFLIMAGVVTPGGPITTNGDGHGIAATAGTYIIAHSRERADTADNNIARVFVTPAVPFGEANP